MDVCAKYALYLILEYVRHFVLSLLIGLLGFAYHDTYSDAAFTCNLFLLTLLCHLSHAWRGPYYIDGDSLN